MTTTNTDTAAAALATALRLLAEDYPTEGGPVTVTVRTGTGPMVEVELTSELAGLITETVTREHAKWDQTHPDQSGICTHCHGAGRADEAQTCRVCSGVMRWRTAAPGDPATSGWWACVDCDALAPGHYRPRNLRAFADLVVDEALAYDESTDLDSLTASLREVMADGLADADRFVLGREEAEAALGPALERRGLAVRAEG
ncbi:hypothetical protein ACFC26_41350 [Kitasatospora purpeofusca]|uniref:hypothetical protein n=1 Tax=Kitasatospora purpeofusca TaxID=67352 RepID=UPI0035DC83E9